MATDAAAAPVNGNYGTQFNGTDSSPAAGSTGVAVNGQGSSSSTGLAASTSGSASTGGNTGTEQSSPSKDEVGWYFVEQYYTTLSRSPEKLHLFYAKRSQFVSGVEAESVNVLVGQRAIGERIKELDIQDCKVRVTNVDSQESGRDIVVQVIGEMSNKSAPHRKFVQTFVLAEQPNGYFVLNDIFRYIADEDDEEEPEVAVPTVTDADKPSGNFEDTADITEAAIGDGPDIVAAASLLEEKIGEKSIESSAQTETEPEPAGQPDSSAEDEAPIVEAAPLEIARAEAAATSSDEDVAQSEKTRSPQLSPKPTDEVITPQPAATLAPEAVAPTPKQVAPKTWASMVAANKAPSPAVPVVPANTPTAPQSRPPVAPAPVSTSAAPTAPQPTDDSQGLPSPGGWQMAGQEHNRKQNRQQGSTSAGEKTSILGYVKNVTERVDAAVLKNTLSKFGRLEYFDVSRPKNCAFVEFADAAGYHAAVAANPHLIGGEEIYVEERRPRPNAYGGSFNPRGGMRGNRGNMDGRSPSQGGRGNYQKDGRGGYTPRGRGGTLTPRGRGMPQAA